jgi:hypothetical protein
MALSQQLSKIGIHADTHVEVFPQVLRASASSNGVASALVFLFDRQQ